MANAGDRAARRLGFWGMDLLRGRPIGRHVEDLRSAFADPEGTLARNRAAAVEFIDSACRNTRYYGRFLGARRLEDLPVLSKATIRGAYEDLLSNEYDRTHLVPVSTSGSYGTPLTYYLTRAKRSRQLAEILFFGQWAGYRVGDAHLYGRIGASKHKGFLTRLMQNEHVVDSTVPDEDCLEQQRILLRQRRVRVMIGYPSVLTLLAQHCEARDGDPRDYGLRAIIAVAEPLHDAARAQLQRVFRCGVWSRYATVELGVLAHECPSGARYHVNVASYIVELLSRQRDEPTRPGEEGRVIVTDLNSHAMPLIRYDTGDIAVAGQACPCGLAGPTLLRIEGRMIEEITSSDGRRVSSLGIQLATKGVDGVVQYQFAQLGDGEYEMRLQVLPSFGQEEVLRGRLAGILGARARIAFRYVEQIAPLPSGKRPVVVNEMSRKEAAAA